MLIWLLKLERKLLGHISTICIAKKYLEEKLNYEVLGGYIHPADGNYCLRKLNKDYITSKKRLELCNLAVAQLDWLMVDLQNNLNSLKFEQELPDLHKRIKAYCVWLRNVDFHVISF